MGKIGKHNDLFVIVVIFLVALFFEYRETFSLIEDETLSYRQLLRTYNADANLTSPADDIVIVYTDEEFYEEYDKYPASACRFVDNSDSTKRDGRVGDCSRHVVGFQKCLWRRSVS